MDVEYLRTEAGNVRFETLELDSCDRVALVAMVMADFRVVCVVVPKDFGPFVRVVVLEPVVVATGSGRTLDGEQSNRSPSPTSKL
jgi:hypothetical protein